MIKLKNGNYQTKSYEKIRENITFFTHYFLNYRDHLGLMSSDLLKMYKELYSDVIHGVISEDVFFEMVAPLKELLLNLDTTIALDLNRAETLEQIADIQAKQNG